MKTIILLTIIFFSSSFNNLICQDNVATTSVTETANQKTLKDIIIDLTKKFDKEKNDAIKTRQDTNLSNFTKTENIRYAKMSAGLVLDELRERFGELDQNKNPYFYKEISDFINDARRYIDTDEVFKAIKPPTTFASILGDAAIISNALQDINVAGKFSIGLEYNQIKNVKTGQKSFFAKGLMVIFSSPDTIKVSRYLTPDGRDSTVNNKQQFGASILNPAAGASSIESGYYESKHYFWQNALGIKKSQVGLELNIGFSSRVWKDSTFTQSSSANVFSFNIGPFIDLLDPKFNSLHIGLNTHLLYITRTLMGDITNNISFRESVLNSSKQFFNGFELGLKIEFSTVSVFVKMPVMINAQGIEGLSGGQFIGGVNFTVPVKTFEL